VSYTSESILYTALWQTRVKYIADLGAPAGTNSISAITFSITLLPYEGIQARAVILTKKRGFMWSI